MNKRHYQEMNWAEIESIIYSDCSHPFELLGPRNLEKETLVQAFFPMAKSVKIVFENSRSLPVEMEEVEEEGFFAAFFPTKKQLKYHYEIVDAKGVVTKKKDPYAFTVPGEETMIKSFLKGMQDHSDEIFGAHVCEADGESGVLFRVYAPNAVRVSVIGNFNRFDGRIYPMEKNESFGVFSLFIPGLQEGDEYAYELKMRNGDVFVRRDPYATAYGTSHAAACKIEKKDDFQWKDEAYIKLRHSMKASESKYLGCNISLADLLAENDSLRIESLVSLLSEMKFTHVNVGNIFETVGGGKRSLKGFFALRDELKKDNCLKRFISLCHDAGIGVLCDYTIGHFGNDEFGLAYFDGTHLYEHADARKGYHSFFDACLFQYKTPWVKSFLHSHLRLLAEDFHFDGIRWMDVAGMLYLDYKKNPGEWICNEQGGNCNFEAISLIREMNHSLSMIDKNILSIGNIDAVWSQATKQSGEESLGFDFVENHGINSALTGCMNATEYERFMAYEELAEQSRYVFGEAFVLPENGIADGLLYALQTFYPGKKSCNLDASLIAEVLDGKKNGKRAKHNLYENMCSCNEIYSKTPLLFENEQNADSFKLLETKDCQNGILAFIRKNDAGDVMLIVANLKDEKCTDYTLNVPYAGVYKNLFKAAHGKGKVTAVTADELSFTEDSFSICVNMPAKCVSAFSYRPFTQKEMTVIEEKRRQERIRYVKAEREKIEKERDAMIAKAIEDATARIRELEKLLK